MFKVGDKVKVIKYDSKWDAPGENRNWIIGEVGEVSHVYEGSDCPYSVEFDNYDDLKEKHSNIPECFMEDELELAQQSKFKVGDRVESHQQFGLIVNSYVGKKGTVVKVQEPERYYNIRVDIDGIGEKIFHENELRPIDESKKEPKFKVGEVYGCNFNAAYRYDCLEVNEEHGYCMFKSNDGLFISTDLNGSFHNYNDAKNTFIIEIKKNKFNVGDCVRVIKNTWESEDKENWETIDIGTLLLVNNLPYKNSEGYVVYRLTEVEKDGYTGTNVEAKEEELELVARGLNG